MAPHLQFELGGLAEWILLSLAPDYGLWCGSCTSRKLLFLEVIITGDGSLRLPGEYQVPMSSATSAIRAQSCLTPSASRRAHVRHKSISVNVWLTVTKLPRTLHASIAINRAVGFIAVETCKGRMRPLVDPFSILQFLRQMASLWERCHGQNPRSVTLFWAQGCK
jgi:hypothetical protein